MPKTAPGRPAGRVLRTSGADAPEAAPAPNSGPGRPERHERRHERYEPYLDGLFTYCLSVLCDHDAATAALGDVLAVAERHHGRAPVEHTTARPAAGPGRRAWLYALARWTCRRRLVEQRRTRPGAHTGRRRPAHAPTPPPVRAHPPVRPPRPAPPGTPRSAADDRGDQLALLAWPEAAGTTPEQREALELSVRHGLATQDIAAVLSLDPAHARDLLATAVCELERTRAALAVVGRGDCPAVARLGADGRVLISAALRTELVRHVDDCPRCRAAAERVEALGPWPGSAPAPAGLPLVRCERPAAYAAMSAARAGRTRAGTPRFGPGGFPLDPKDHAARRERLRARAVTTTVVATVLAAPVLALWAAYRGAPATGESGAGPAVTTEDPGNGADTGTEHPGDRHDPYDRYEHTGSAAPTGSAGRPGVTVEVVSTGTAPRTRPGAPAPGRLGVTARAYGDTTRLTLTASGGAPVDWTVRTGARWLLPNRAAGTLRPGQSVTVLVTVDRDREPAGPWRAYLRIDPAGAVLRIEGGGRTPPLPTRPPRPTGSPTPSPTPTPTPTPTPSPTPSPTPTEPTPTPSPTPTPTDPDPSPTPSGDDGTEPSPGP